MRTRLQRAQKACGQKGLSRQKFQVCVRKKLRSGRFGGSSSGGSGGGAGSNSPTRTEVRSPTRTSTEVRSPTSTSTDAYTSGNVTVTGGAGDGNTTVHVYPGRLGPTKSRAGKAAKRERRMQKGAAKTGRARR